MSLRIVPRLRSSGLITQRNQERRHVFAVLTSLGERRACTDRFDAIGRQFDAYGMRFGVAGADDTAGAHVANFDVLDNATSKVLEPPQKSSRAEQAA
jgi:hypothetical protein